MLVKRQEAFFKRAVSVKVKLTDKGYISFLFIDFLITRLFVKSKATYWR